MDEATTLGLLFEYLCLCQHECRHAHGCMFGHETGVIFFPLCLSLDFCQCLCPVQFKELKEIVGSWIITMRLYPGNFNSSAIKSILGLWPHHLCHNISLSQVMLFAFAL